MPIPAFAIPDLHGRHAVVTGSNTGIGYATSLRFALAGADVTFAVRNLDKGRAALDRLQSSAEFQNVEIPGNLSLQLVDVASLESVRQASVTMLAEGRAIDILVLNAGIMRAGQYQCTTDGFELQMATNYLGQFALTARLMPLLRTARVVTVGSIMANLGSIRRENLNAERRYQASLQYGTSKLACVAYAKELQRRSLANDWGIEALSAHPGATRTHLTMSLQPETGLAAVIRPLGRGLRGVWQDADMGCLPIVHAATSEFARGGDYFGPSGFMECNGYPSLARVPKGARSLASNQKLFDASEALVGVCHDR